jgi:hypothetical protein
VTVAIIEFGLLGAIAARAATRSFNDLDVGGVDLDFGNVSTLVRCGESLNVLRKEGESGLVVVLAEEVSFADRLRGERSVEGKRGTD